MKRKLQLVIGLILILLGVVLLALPRLSTQMIKNESGQALQRLEQINPQQLRDNAQKEVEFDFDVIDSINVQDTLTGGLSRNILGSQSLIDKYEQDMVGQLIIEELNIDLAIYNGINNEKLLIGSTTMKPGQVMGQGNYSISSHYTDGRDVLFNRLPDIKTGMVVKITDKETVYEYVIYETALVDVTATYLIEDAQANQHGSPIISLMSCYYFNYPDQRWFAFGELVNTYPFQ